ncbi:MAG: hypothetical protein ACFB5Z_00540 [Elainellaceae cyanobacterium]
MPEQYNRNQPGDPKEAEAGRGAPGSQWAVQTAQSTDVNPDDAKIPTDADVEKNIQDVKAVDEQEAGTGMSTTDGYVVDEAGRLDNFAVEPPIRVEGQDS